MTWHPTSVAARPPHDQRPVPLTAGGRSVVLVPWDGAWFAIEDRCSHAGCAFSEDGVVEDGRMICECHGSEFDLMTGTVRRPPARTAIATFAVRVTDGVVEVSVP